MADSPLNHSEFTIRHSITADGTALADTTPIVSIHTRYEINRIPTAEIVIIDGSVETADFPISNAATLIPGVKVTISAGYGEQEALIFSGVIVKQAIRISAESSFLVVTCKHEAVEMTFNKKEAIFLQQKDSDIISAILGTYSALSPTVGSTSVQHESMVQKLATDWDFVLARAEACGFVISYTMSNIVIQAPELSTEPVLSMTYGMDITEFDAELNAERQPASVDASSWDLATQAMTKSSATEPTINAQGNITGVQLSSKLNQKPLSLNSGSPMTTDSLKSWADASLLRMRLSALRGTVSFQGSSLVMPGNIIELNGVGARFNGKAYVSSVEHSLVDGDWKTTARFGLENNPVAERPDFSYTPAAGQVPSVHGLQVAVVMKLDADPANEFRIQVKFGGISETDVTMWARMGNFYATGTSGSFFLPEIGDEVVIGFLDNNPLSPVILGSLYSSKNAPETTVAAGNYVKGITTKSKLKISFDDEKKITKISTPGGNTVTLDDDGKAVEIVDQNSNSIKMTASGIEIKSAKDLTLKATGKIVLDATAALSISSKADVAIEGLNINSTAQVGFVAKGNASAEISASGQTVVKGALVMIN
ncbi:MAG: type VI secretion system tip protein VgrG [Daejeonella sp.]|uniref:type VI secretion system tip protein VgrG n=1 Tax=Daejeonella sp. JGW-45 TaxID=3034148 RepID=UPI0023ED6DDA|nr:type VI secretion system tip protein VgrG [Daejeonella sp. JGW-45]